MQRDRIRHLEIEELRNDIQLQTEASAWPSVAGIIAGAFAQGDRYLVYTLSPGLTVETDTPLRPEDFRVN